MSEACGNCGTPTGGRPYCSECGQRTDAVTLHLDLGTSTVVERSTRGRKIAAAIGGVALVAAAGGFMLSGGDDDDAVAPSTSTTATSTTTVVEDPVEAPDDRAAPSTVLGTQDTLPPPGFDRDLNTYVISVEAGALQRLDLDTGETVAFELDGFAQRTLHAMGDEVAILDLNTGDFQEVIVEPFALGRTIEFDGGVFPQGTSGDALVLQQQSAEDSITHYHIMRSFDEAPLEVALPLDFFLISVVPSGDNVILNSFLGSFVWDGERVLQRFDGLVLAVDEGRALTYSCDDALECTMSVGAPGDRGVRLPDWLNLESPFMFGFGAGGVRDGLVLTIGFPNTADEPGLQATVIDLATGSADRYSLPSRPRDIDPFDWTLLPDGSGMVSRTDVFDFECECSVTYAESPIGIPNFGQTGVVAVPKPGAS